MAYKIAAIQNRTIERLDELTRIQARIVGQQDAILMQMNDYIQTSANNFIMGNFFSALPPKEKSRLVRAIMKAMREHGETNVDEKLLLHEIMEYFHKDENTSRTKPYSYI